MPVAHSSLIVLSFSNNHKHQFRDIPSSWQLYKTDFILIPVTPLVLRFSWDMFSIHLPHRNQRYECAYGIQPNQRQMRLDEYAFGIRHDLSGVDM